MADSYAVLLKATLARLNAVTAVTDIVSARIYTDVPQDAEFPYAVVNISSGDFSAKDFTGMEHEIQVQGFSRDSSALEAANLRGAVYDALNRQESNLTLDTGNVASIQYTGIGFVEREPDGVTWQSLIRLRCVVT